MRAAYIGTQLRDENRFDAELVEIKISELKWGKAAGLDGLTAEHLQHCHGLLPCVLAKLFNVVLFNVITAMFHWLSVLVTQFQSQKVPTTSH